MFYFFTLPPSLKYTLPLYVNSEALLFLAFAHAFKYPSSKPL